MNPLLPRVLVWIAAGLAAASVAVAARPLARHLAGESGLPPPVVAVAPPPAEAIASVDAILAWSPFGRMAGPEVAPAAGPTLELTLHGVVIADAPDRSVAILPPPSGLSAVFAVGQEVAPGATLAEVRGDRVVLLVDGAPETLEFPETRRDIDPGVAALQAVVSDDPAALPGEIALPAPLATE
jgi:general secretion pathway protein C